MTQRSTSSPAPDDLTSSRVLLVVGKALANLIAMTLRGGSYELRDCSSEADCRRLIAEWQPHMALIDIDHYNPFIEVVSGAVAKDGFPIVALTRKRETALKLDAFQRGADDIIELPFTLDEIVARPFALMRRARGVVPPLHARIKLNSVLEVDLVAQTVTLEGGRALDLTPIQQTLLYILAANTGEVLTRETLIASIWGSASQIESNVVDRHIRELRVKLADDWRTPRYIETVPGQGYRWRVQPHG